MKPLRYLPIGLAALTLLLQGCTPAVVAGAAAEGGVVAHDQRTVGAMVDDESIELKVMAAIAEDKTLNERCHINATSYNGVVLLTGEAPTTEMRDRISDIARKIQRVRQVQNEMAIAQPSSVGSRAKDTYITAKIKTKLLSNKQVDGLNMKVVTEAGVVYLMGITSREQARLASDIARDTDGVRLVVKVYEYTD